MEPASSVRKLVVQEHLPIAREHPLAMRERLPFARKRLLAVREHLPVAQKHLLAVRERLRVSRERLLVAQKHLLAAWEYPLNLLAIMCANRKQSELSTMNTRYADLMYPSYHILTEFTGFRLTATTGARGS